MGDVEVRFADLSKLKYQEQAVWFLNGFWNDGAKEIAESLWDNVQQFSELDPKGKDGNELDEFNSHRVLEKYDETLSVVKMREALRSIDVDANGQMSLIEFLIWKFKKSVADCVNAPQGDNQELVRACEEQIQQVQKSLDDVLAKQEATKQAIAESQAAIRDLEQKERELVQAEAEAKEAVAALKAEEDAYNAKLAELERKSTDTSIGIVTRNKASNELQQMKAEDPLPLRKAKITQEAAVRLVQKAQKATAEAKIEAEQKKVALEETQKQLEAAQAQLEEEMAEAQVALEKAKAGGSSHGNFWFMERQLYEADKSLARARQKYDHSKPFQYTES